MHGLRPVPTDQITPPTPPAHNIVTEFGAEMWAELDLLLKCLFMLLYLVCSGRKSHSIGRGSVRPSVRPSVGSCEGGNAGNGFR